MLMDGGPRRGGTASRHAQVWFRDTEADGLRKVAVVVVVVVVGRGGSMKSPGTARGLIS